MSNNAAERALRCVAVGRRNWTFAGSDDGGRRAAAIYTLIETALCRARHRAVYADRRTMPGGLVFPGIHSNRRMICSA
jgi:transposase